MADGIEAAPVNTGPQIADTIDEVRGRFAGDAALQDAIARLLQNGFDRADLSLPVPQPDAGKATPEQGADNPTTEVDSQQARTLHTSMAASVGALAAAGVAIATGGAAVVAITAAAAVGLGAGAVAQAATQLTDAADHESREQAAAAGELVLSVRIVSPTRADVATTLLQAAGATEVVTITRRNDAIDSARWTG